jgi:hypothetical protein
MKTRAGSRPRLLIGDGLVAHESLEVCYSSGVTTPTPQGRCDKAEVQSNDNQSITNHMFLIGSEFGFGLKWFSSCQLGLEMVRLRFQRSEPRTGT